MAKSMIFAASALLLLILSTTAVVSVSALSYGNKVLPKDIPEFECQVCLAFAREYSDRINDKKTDDHPSILNDYATGNASNYVWYAKDKTLYTREYGLGIDVVDEIRSFLDEKLLTHRAQDITLHAVHSAAHRRNPARVAYGFVWQVLCVESEKVCQPDPKHHEDKEFEIVRHHYDNFRHIYEEPHGHIYNQDNHDHGDPLPTNMDDVNVPEPHENIHEAATGHLPGEYDEDGQYVPEPIEAEGDL